MSAPGSSAPEVRIFRRIFQGIYAILLVGFFGTIAVSATYGAFRDPEPVAATLPAGGDCDTHLTRLFAELEDAGVRTIRQVHLPDSAQAWKTFSDGFRARLTTLEQTCPDRAVLAAELERQRLGYETARRALAQVAGAARGHLVETLRPDAVPAP